MAACFSQPKRAEILADAFASLASIQGVTDINVWLSQIEGIYCECPECRDTGQVRAGDGGGRGEAAPAGAQVDQIVRSRFLLS
jgi:hypothetical protein